ncbi:hypothetical protein BDA96_01G092000 [Sorghum bicolor]|uniref:Uncharacterized protein n=1 Tax=Sorghum bicolor TaxID=4558 RepID=A0A921UXM3_SORBI|nr:hypothetical protein BDA96_01G092000 [Sorghum bicolor]
MRRDFSPHSHRLCPASARSSPRHGYAPPSLSSCPHSDEQIWRPPQLQRSDLAVA